MSYTPIRYDKKSEKEWIIRLVISLSIILLYIIMLFIEANAFVSSGINPLSDSSLFTVFFVFLSVLEYIAVPVFVISILMVLDSYMYLKRLKKNYFEVPVDKKIYEKNLSNVPRTKVVENVYARDSWIGAIFFLMVIFPEHIAGSSSSAFCFQKRKIFKVLIAIRHSWKNVFRNIR